MTQTVQADVVRTGEVQLAPDDGTIDRTKWTPTPEQFAAYRAKEVVMCVTMLRRHGSTPNAMGALRHDHTLFSYKTWEAAQRELATTAD